MEIIKEFTMQDFKDMEALERKFYDESHITPYEEVYKWYEKYPYTVCGVRNGKELVGFLNMFPIKKNIFEEMKAGRFNDRDLTMDNVVDINKIKEKSINLFLCCIVVDSQYRKSNVVETLIRENISYYKDIQEKIEFIITDNVTNEGERFSRKLGLEKVIDTEYNSRIYMGKYKEFMSGFGAFYHGL